MRPSSSPAAAQTSENPVAFTSDNYAPKSVGFHSLKRLKERLLVRMFATAGHNPSIVRLNEAKASPPRCGGLIVVEFVDPVMLPGQATFMGVSGSSGRSAT